MNNRVLGFDYGGKTIGVATGNLITRTTESLAAIPASANKPDWRRITGVVREWRPALLLVGLPVGQSGEETTMSRRTRSFAATLEQETGVPFAMVDERYTSAAADSLLRETAEAGKGHNKRIADRRNSLAAELIIQTYFNDNPGPCHPPPSHPPPSQS